MNKPVAWMDSWGDVEKFNHNNENWTPLYTHPAELTDKEIIEIYFNDPGFLNFARAILRKAQEK